MKRSSIFRSFALPVLGLSTFALLLTTSSARAQLEKSTLYVENGSAITSILGSAVAGTITLPGVTGLAITTGNLTGITATGTIGSGIWNGAAIGSQYGGTGMDLHTANGYLFFTNGVASTPASIPSTSLDHNSVTVSAGTGLSGGGTVALGNSITLTNAGVLSFNSRTGAVTPANGDYTTSQVTEGTNLYFTNARATAALSATDPILYNTTTGGISWDAAATLANSTTGSAAKLTTPRAINGVNFDGSAPITVTAAANTLTGSTLATGVTASSLQSVGTLSGLTVSAAPTITPWTTAGVVHNAATTGTLSSSLIVDADVSATAAIADTKLATISSAGKVANSATTATTANTASTIVLRDGSGNVPGSITGNANTVTNGIYTNTTNTLTGMNSFAPTTDIVGATVKQTSAATPNSDILDVTASNGTTKYLSVDKNGVTTLGVSGTATGSIAFANSTASTALTTLAGGSATTAESYNMPDTALSGNTLAYTTNASGYPSMTFVESYAPSQVTLSAGTTYVATGASVVLSPGVWLITSETLVDASSNSPGAVEAMLGTSTTNAYTSGEIGYGDKGSGTSHTLGGTIYLSKIVSLTASTTVKTYAASTTNAGHIEITPPDNTTGTAGTATAIHAIRIK